MWDDEHDEDGREYIDIEYWDVNETNYVYGNGICTPINKILNYWNIEHV